MLTRREFLKLSALLPLTYAGAHRLTPRRPAAAAAPNFLILLFDTFTASNLSLFGYGRHTTPNLERLAERAIVYRQHYAGGNFTTPATASLLTGMVPWTHRAIRLFDRVDPALARNNLFALFDDYHRVGYAQNPVANTLLVQFMRDLDEYLPLHAAVPWRDVLFTRLFSRDHIVATAARNLSLRGQFERSGSLFLSPLYNRIWRAKETGLRRDNGDEFPLGLPTLDEENHMTLDGNTDFLLEHVAGLPRPYLAYFHFFPPHGPYRPTRAHLERFQNDTFEPPPKPLHPLKMESNSGRFPVERRWYDSYLSNLDEQLGRLFGLLEQRGLLQNTFVFLTADHGEMFERGIIKHFHKSLHQPVMHIPLLIFPPGLDERVDILSPTSALDILPTLLHLAGKPHAPWAEGRPLRPFRGGPVDAERPFYALEAKESHPARPLGKSSAMVVRWPYKLTHYYGYPELAGSGGRLTELYDLEQDPEELNDLAGQTPELAEELLALLLDRMEEADAPYRT
jgi:arylsulfatase A-like enzyme